MMVTSKPTSHGGPSMQITLNAGDQQWQFLFTRVATQIR